MYSDLMSKRNSPRDYLVSAQSHSITMQSIAAELSIRYTPTKYHALEGFSVSAISLEEEKEETKGFIAFIKKIWQKIKEFFSKMWNYIKSFFSRMFSSSKVQEKVNKDTTKELKDISNREEDLLKEKKQLQEEIDHIKRDIANLRKQPIEEVPVEIQKAEEKFEKIDDQLQIVEKQVETVEKLISQNLITIIYNVFMSNPEDIPREISSDEYLAVLDKFIASVQEFNETVLTLSHRLMSVDKAQDLVNRLTKALESLPLYYDSKSEEHRLAYQEFEISDKINPVKIVKESLEKMVESVTGLINSRGDIVKVSYHDFIRDDRYKDTLDTAVKFKGKTLKDIESGGYNIIRIPLSDQFDDIFSIYCFYSIGKFTPFDRTTYAGSHLADMTIEYISDIFFVTVSDDYGLPSRELTATKVNIEEDINKIVEFKEKWDGRVNTATNSYNATMEAIKDFFDDYEKLDAEKLTEVLLVSNKNLGKYIHQDDRGDSAVDKIYRNAQELDEGRHRYGTNKPIEASQMSSLMDNVVGGSRTSMATVYNKFLSEYIKIYTAYARAVNIMPIVSKIFVNNIYSVLAHDKEHIIKVCEEAIKRANSIKE